VQIAAAQHLKCGRKLASKSCRVDPQSSFRIRHMQLVNCVGEHRFVAEIPIQLTLFQLSQVSEKQCVDASVLANPVMDAKHQLIIRESFNRFELFHISPCTTIYNTYFLSV